MRLRQRNLRKWVSLSAAVAIWVLITSNIPPRLGKNLNEIQTGFAKGEHGRFRTGRTGKTKKGSRGGAETAERNIERLRSSRNEEFFYIALRREKQRINGIIQARRTQQT